jgi:nucleoid-associated protein YgaU
MNRKIVVVFTALWIAGAVSLGAQTQEPAFTPLIILAAATAPDAAAPVIPADIKNNQYYLESLRLTQLAQETFDYGDYDASTEYAAEAIRYAQLSDEYVALQLVIKATNDAITAARGRLDWAASVDAPNRYPREFGEAQDYYDEAVALRSEESWDDAIIAAERAIVILAAVQEAPSRPALPAQYTVRTWASSRDCLWNIAGRAWVYGDPTKWRVLYDANRARLPEPDNPNLITPGLILNIPPIQGEVRQGMWDANRTYQPLR